MGNPNTLNSFIKKNQVFFFAKNFGFTTENDTNSDYNFNKKNLTSGPQTHGCLLNQWTAVGLRALTGAPPSGTN